MTVGEVLQALAEHPLEAEVYLEDWQTYSKASQVVLKELKQTQWAVVKSSTNPGTTFDAVLIKKEPHDYE